MREKGKNMRRSWSIKWYEFSRGSMGYIRTVTDGYVEVRGLQLWSRS